MKALRSALLAKGTVLSVKLPGATLLPAIRVRETCWDVPSEKDLERALRLLESGADAHALAAVVGHGDPSTVRAFLRVCIDTEKDVKLPPTLLDADPEALSGDDRLRASTRPSDFFRHQFTIEACGARRERNGDLVPVLPIHWVGQGFQDGAALDAAISQLEEEQAGNLKDIRGLIRYENLARSHNIWETKEDLTRTIHARGLKPSVLVRVRKETPQTSLIPFSDANWDAVDANSHAFQVLSGRDGNLSGDKKEDHSIVLAVHESLLQESGAAATSGHASRHSSEHTSVLEKEPKLEPISSVTPLPPDAGGPQRGENFLPPPSRTMLDIELPLSLLHKSILRGTSFSSPRQANFAVEQLLMTKTIGHLGASATHLLLWRLFSCAWRDVCPYFPPARSTTVFTLPDLLGLSLVSYVDPSFSLSEKLAARAKKTALSLQAHEDITSVLWPWRGFRKQTREKTLVVEDAPDDAVAQLRNTLRCASMGPFPLASAADRDMFRRYLSCLQEPSWAAKVQPLPAARVTKASLSMAAPARAAELETMQASMDGRFSANVLLFLQASMDTPPKNTLQHSIRSLGMLVDRISSTLNVRAIRKQLAGQENEAELFRIQQFLGAKSENPKSSENTHAANGDVPAPPVKLQETVHDTVKLTPHERVLSAVLHDVQRALWKNTMDHAPAVWRDGPYGIHATDMPAHEPSKHFIKSIAPSARAMSTGREPTALEARTAFLQLFGRQTILPAAKGAAKGETLSVVLAGTTEEPLLVRLVEPKATSSMQQPNRFLDASNPLVAEARLRLCALGPQSVKVAFPPPQGFRWIWEDPSLATRQHAVSIVSTEVRLGAASTRKRGTRRQKSKGGADPGASASLEFFVNDKAIPAFDASSLLVPCNTPADQKPLGGELSALVSRAFYVSTSAKTKSKRNGKDKGKAPRRPESGTPKDSLDLFRDLETAARVGRQGNVDAIYDWHSVRDATPISAHVFRDLLLKVMMMEGNTFSLSASAGANSQHWQQDFTNEGTALRAMFALCALYPGCVERVAEHQFQTFTRFRVLSKSNVQYVDLIESLRRLAFPPEITQDADAAQLASDASASTQSAVAVTTKLWSHQQETVDKVTGGIQSGMLGFADASTVGAGKTLSALACIAGAQDIIAGKGETLRGSLVLLPTNALISEWATQIMLHTKGVHVIAQDKSGFLKSLGISNAGGPARRIARGRHVKVDADSIVLTTLGRARDHPFSTLGWDLVIIDECVSVQSQTALQSFAAWRQVLASNCGVMMLSATMYRSRMADLFVLIRMLRSPLPRTQPYLATLLSEHAIVALPENPRKWVMEFRPVHLEMSAQERYRAIVEQSFHGNGVSDARTLYKDLKTFLRHNYERSEAVESIASEVAAMRDQGRRPLVFAANENEKKLLLGAIPNAESLPASSKDRDKVLVVTVREGSHGLNLQEHADAIVTRPQPGDIMEQMKGRIDRPGQKIKTLLLTIVVAHDTIEEAEAANIRICGSFFRQYLDPLSRTFQERAMSSAESVFDAQRATASNPQESSPRPARGKAKRSSVSTASSTLAPLRYRSRYEGILAQNFRAHLESSFTSDDSASAVASVSTTTGNRGGRKRETAKDNDDDPGEQGSDEDFVDESEVNLSPPSKRRRTAARAVKGRTLDSDSVKKKNLEEAVVKPRKAGKKTVEKGPVKAKRKKRPPEEAFLGSGPPQVISDELMAQALAHFAKNDAKMANVVNQVGAPTQLMEMVGTADPFMALTRSIIYQQISTKAGASIFKKFSALLNDAVTPENVLAMSQEKLRTAGLSARKAEYVHCLAAHFQAEKLSRAQLDAMTDDEVFRSLIKVKGIGPWSIHMFLLFSLGRPDVLPYGDLVVRKGFKRLYQLSNGEEIEDTKVVRLPDEHELLELSTTWRPFRSIGTWLMWHAVESESAVYTF
ncbi:DNA-3-methyladenine glycosylase 1 [Hondaea fermentalgiana]|uniref:DNA-3-methyladenine glycosylase 1 n=1 Tax=Hondaea fermentalgiana TaxID=2315210 RepID=A0A2R5GCS2_9STRA|nr:DNA-3-methyladenine glycosylase 1 [Hondaea fermentalgiana]|eukprot:GBG27498.1 DNA-3-methyladenine glycosylase 1 [Hondaea fermentalgiana]